MKAIGLAKAYREFKAVYQAFNKCGTGKRILDTTLDTLDTTVKQKEKDRLEAVRLVKDLLGQTVANKKIAVTSLKTALGELKKLLAA